MRKLAVPVLVGLSAVVGAGGLTVAAAQPAASAGSCGPAHRYVDAHSAKVLPDDVVQVKGKSATLRCGGPDDSSYVDGKSITLTLTSAATVKVWKTPEDPDGGTRTVPGTALPKWLKKNRSEPIYKITGPSSGVTKLVEEWHP